MIYSLECEDLPEGWTPLEAVAVVKALDENGDVGLVLRSTDGLRAWDQVGMLTAVLDRARDDLQAGFVSDDDDE